MLILSHPRIPDEPVRLPVQRFSGWSPDTEAISRDRMREGVLTQARVRILSIGDDPALLYSRRLVLERAGYLVASLRSDAVIEDAQLRGFDLVMICHSIPDRIANNILEIVWRLAPETPVLLVSGPDGPSCSGPHQVTVPASPAAMLGAVAEQLAIHGSSEIRGRS